MEIIRTKSQFDTLDERDVVIIASGEVYSVEDARIEISDEKLRVFDVVPCVMVLSAEERDEAEDDLYNARNTGQ